MLLCSCIVLGCTAYKAVSKTNLLHALRNLWFNLRQWRSANTQVERARARLCCEDFIKSNDYSSVKMSWDWSQRGKHHTLASQPQADIEPSHQALSVDDKEDSMEGGGRQDMNGSLESEDLESNSSSCPLPVISIPWVTISSPTKFR